MFKELENSTDFEKIISENEIVLVDFFATWCGPCKMLGPVLHEYSDKHENVFVLKVDVDQFGSLANKYSIYSIPALFLFKNGELVNKTLGFTDINGLEKFVG